MEITAAGNTTIVITTHYIEEARQANVVSYRGSYCECVCNCGTVFLLI